MLANLAMVVVAEGGADGVDAFGQSLIGDDGGSRQVQRLVQAAQQEIAVAVDAARLPRRRRRLDRRLRRLAGETKQKR